MTKKRTTGWGVRSKPTKKRATGWGVTTPPKKKRTAAVNKAATKSDNSKVVAHPPTVIRSVRVSSIAVDEKKFRPLNKKTVASLMESVSEIGLIHPPTVSESEIEGDDEELEYNLITGHHRLTVVQNLGWKTVQVIVVPDAERENKMRHVSENLHRSNLTKPEEGEAVKVWLELLFTRKGGQLAQPHDKGVSAAAKEFGKSRRTILRLLKAHAIKPDAALALKEAKLDNNGAVLEQISHAKLSKQADLVAEIVREREEKIADRQRKKAALEAKKAKEGDLPKTKSPSIMPSGGKKASGVGDHDDDAGSPDYKELKSVWKASREFREAWSLCDEEERQRFIDEVLLVMNDDDVEEDGPTSGDEDEDEEEED